MASIIYKRNRIDPTRISGPYPLLALMLLVAEILFVIWFYKSQSSTERTIAGSIMALVFISLMILVLRMNRAQRKESDFQTKLNYMTLFCNNSTPLKTTITRMFQSFQVKQYFF